MNYAKMPDGKPLIHFKSALMNIDSEVYFLRGKCENNRITFEFVMMANEEKCNKFISSISIMDCNQRPAFVGSFSPRPLELSHEEKESLCVTTKTLDKWTCGDGKIRFKVKVQSEKGESEEEEIEDEDIDREESKEERDMSVDDENLSLK